MSFPARDFNSEASNPSETISTTPHHQAGLYYSIILLLSANPLKTVCLTALGPHHPSVTPHPEACFCYLRHFFSRFLEEQKQFFFYEK